MDTIFESIKSLVYQQIGNNKIELNRETRLYKDLKIDGDDAFELLQSFMVKFKVDMAGFDFNKYFAPEGTDLIGAVANLFNGKKTQLKELTLGDLEVIAKTGKWTNLSNS